MENKKGFKFKRSQLSIPYAIFLLLFVLLPLILIIYYAFTDANGQFCYFNNFVDFFKDNSKLSTLLISIVIGAINTIICLLIGYPVAYLLANKKYNKSKIMILLFIIQEQKRIGTRLMFIHIMNLC